MDEEDTSTTNSKRWKPQKCSSFRLGRSRGSALFSESIPSESARFTSYDRLSKSTRLSGESPVHVGFKKNHYKKSKALGFISRVFSFRRSNGRNDITGQPNTLVVVAEKKRRSWLPDPNRRWPVQGW